jgi:hypothetical protein
LPCHLPLARWVCSDKKQRSAGNWEIWEAMLSLMLSNILLRLSRWLIWISIFMMVLFPQRASAYIAPFLTGDLVFLQHCSPFFL